ncbi:aldo/keto reductase [Thioclava sp. BHET1]|nr:aldo/keto reductase [Thioclava sp. BHET1]
MTRGLAGIEPNGLTMPGHDEAAAVFKAAFGAGVMFSRIRPHGKRGAHAEPGAQNGLRPGTAMVHASMLRLAGKYHASDDLAGRKRAGMVESDQPPRGDKLVTTLTGVAAAHGAKPAEIALAGILSRGGVTAPIASATRLAPVESRAPTAALSLSERDMRQLDEITD